MCTTPVELMMGLHAAPRRIRWFRGARTHDFVRTLVRGPVTLQLL